MTVPQKILIIGGPKAGKTTLADKIHKKYGHTVYHTDDVMHLGWSDASLEVSTWLDREGPWVVEGVSTARALRKWITYAGYAPDFTLLILDNPVQSLTPAQEAMTKGVFKVFEEIQTAWSQRGGKTISKQALKL